MGPLISVFVMVLIISILVGVTFLFVGNLQTTTTNAATSADIRSGTTDVQGESVTLATPGTPLASNSSSLGLRDVRCTIVEVYNSTGAEQSIMLPGNYTEVSECVLANASTLDVSYPMPWIVNYSYTSLPYTNAENAVNETGVAGYSVVGYLPLIFLAIIFGALLTLVLKIILPYINLGQQFNSGM